MRHASAHCGAGWQIAEGSFQMDVPGTSADQAAAVNMATVPDQAGAPDQASVTDQATLLAGGYPTDTQAAMPDQAAAAVPVQVSAAAPIQAAEAKGDGQADLLFVQQATTAQLIFDDPNTATDQARLVLTGVSPATTWCVRADTRKCLSLCPVTAAFAQRALQSAISVDCIMQCKWPHVIYLDHSMASAMHHHPQRLSFQECLGNHSEGPRCLPTPAPLW